MKTQHNVWMLKGLVLAMGMASYTVGHAQTTAKQAQSGQQDIEQLRNEVKMLRDLLEQYAGQQQKLSHNIEAQQQALAVSNQKSLPASALKQKLRLANEAVDMSFYGNIRADMSYQQDGGSASRLYNQINTVPLHGNADSQERLKSTLAATRLGVDIKSNVGDAKVGGKLEVDFLGSGDSLRIRHAYMTYNDLLIGQTWSNFAVPDYIPETIDALAYVGASVKRTPQVRYQWALGPSTQLLTALEDSKDASSKMRLPALTGRLNHSFSPDFNVSLRAMVDEKRNAEDETTAWGVGLGAKYMITPATTLKADYYHVKGDSSFVSYSNPGFVSNTDNQIVARNEFDSISIGLTQAFNEQWRGTLGYGYMKADDKNSYKKAAGDLTMVNKDLWQAWANVFYSPSKPVSLGVEYVYGERTAFKASDFGRDTGKDNRVNAVAIYSF